MHNSGQDTLCNNSNTEHGAAVVVKFDNIAVLDTSVLGIFRMNSCRPPGIAVFHDAMGRDLIQPGCVLVIMRVE